MGHVVRERDALDGPRLGGERAEILGCLVGGGVRGPEPVPRKVDRGGPVAEQGEFGLEGREGERVREGAVDEDEGRKIRHTPQAPTK
ncbi:hypothetical protein GCM10010231_20240 [Streptomyces sindenensis]|nr:hypothetical protein GCM10010231_20240 [Streptomyces sindenensis]